jgi:hypothetical protein
LDTSLLMATTRYSAFCGYGGSHCHHAMKAQLRIGQVFVRSEASLQASRACFGPIGKCFDWCSTADAVLHQRSQT